MKTIAVNLIANASRLYFSIRKRRLHTVVPVFAVLLGCCLNQSARAQTYTVTNLFTVAAGVGNLTTGSVNRGMAYNAVSNQVYVCTASTAPVIGVFDGTAGTYIGNFLSMSGVSGGTFYVDQIGVAADGTTYGINLSTSSSTANNIYQWTGWQATPTTAFSGNALGNGGSIPETSGRIGDTLAVRGAGTGTEILAGVGGTSGKGFLVIFSTANGTTFTPTIINLGASISLAANVYGICFYTNNTCLIKAASSGVSTVYLVQYPANYSSQQVVTGTVLASTSLGGQYNNTTLLSFSPAANFLAGITTAGNPTPVALFNAANISGGTVVLVNTNISTPTSNGNGTGGVAFGGQGGTNTIYAMDTANGFSAWNIVTIPSQPPSISTAPVGGTVYSSDLLTVAATGTSPFSYQWLASVSNSATGTFTNIPSATTNSLAIGALSTNYYEVLITNIAGSITSTPVQVVIIQPITNAAVAGLWRVAPGQTGYSYLSASDNNERGLAYDTNSQRVVVAATSGLYVLNGNNGTNIETLSLTGVTFGGLLGGCDQVGIADDGAVYAGNLINAGGNFNLYRWSAPSNIVTATSAFAADPGNGNAGAERWGDTMAVRGAGPNTQILLGSRASAPGGTNVAFLTPNDGQGLTYSSTIIAVSGVPAGFAGSAISFGAGNTFWAKSYGGDLYEIAFDTNSDTATVIFDYKEPSQISAALTGLGVDPVNNVFASVKPSDSPNDLQFYQFTGTSDSPVLFDQAFFATANANGNDNAAVTLKYPRAYALDVNNGIVAYTYGVPATTAPSIGTAPASVTTYTNIPFVTFSVGASGSLPLYYQWQFNSNDISGANSSVYTITNPSLSSAGYYDVVVHNIAGAITSTPPALLTLIVPTTSLVVTQLWTLPAGTYSFLDGSSYDTRGIAYDTNSGLLAVADNSNIHLLQATNGAYLGDLNPAGAFSGGYNGWLFDQVGIADDGTLYAANLTLTGPDFVILSWAPGYAPGSPGTQFVYGGSGSTATGADPGNGSGDRWGDTMDVRGSGTNTQIIIGSYSGTNVVIFTTPDGANFNANLIPITNVPAGFSGQGIAFGPGNTFYTKIPGYLFRQVTYDLVNLVGGATQVYTTMPSAFDGIGVDVNAGVLGGVNFSDVPNDFQLYLLSGNTNGPDLFDQAFFGSVNGNGQLNAATTLKGGLGFSLDVNNGITALSYGAQPAPGITFTSIAYAPGNTVLTWNNTYNGHMYQVQYKTSLLSPSWSDLGSPVTASGPTASYTDTSAAGATRFYRVISQ